MKTKTKVAPVPRLARRAAAFAFGDALLLVTVALAGTWVMHSTHEAGLGTWPAALLGMLAAMLVQLVLATIVAPLLGSIESMVPSAVVGMTVPAVVCALTLLGVPWHRPTLYGAAAALALTFFAWIRYYGWQSRRRFRHLFRQRAARDLMRPAAERASDVG